mmetsp:Transcript_124143/g.247331  ORF Transcript_124143/g.247331 Transcript_124143/m.247331 type:complete len:242 (+) Transcript_124143:1439-2164(+)
MGFGVQVLQQNVALWLRPRIVLLEESPVVTCITKLPQRSAPFIERELSIAINIQTQPPSTDERAICSLAKLLKTLCSGVGTVRLTIGSARLSKLSLLRYLQRPLELVFETTVLSFCKAELSGLPAAASSGFVRLSDHAEVSTIEGLVTFSVKVLQGEKIPVDIWLQDPEKLRSVTGEAKLLTRLQEARLCHTSQTLGVKPPEPSEQNVSMLLYQLPFKLFELPVRFGVKVRKHNVALFLRV